MQPLILKVASNDGMEAYFSKGTNKRASSDGMEEYFSKAATMNDPTDMPSGGNEKNTAIVKSAPTVKVHKSVKLKFSAACYVGFGQNTLILGDMDNTKLVKYSVDGKYSEVWSKNLPQGVRVNSDKYLTSSLIICQNDYNYPTLTFNHELQPQQTYSNHYGYLRGTIHDDRVLYAKRISEGSGEGYHLEIFQLPHHSHMGTLSRPGAPFKDWRISVCSHKSTQWLALVSQHPHGLDIYEAAYNHMMHVDLPYKARAVTAVAAVKDWIIIADYGGKCLHVYNWHGEELRTVTNQQLELGGDHIYGIGRVGDRGLNIAAGDNLQVKTLHLYNVK